MPSDRIRGYSLWGVQGLLALLFAGSGVGKFVDPQNAVHLTRTILGGAIGTAEAQVLVVAVSGAEVALSGLLVSGWWLRETLGLSFVLIAGFTLGLATLLGGKGVATCGCFGAFGLGLSLEATLLRNLVVLALVLTGMLLAEIRIEKEQERMHH
jgi:hypothetical protein